MNLKLHARVKALRTHNEYSSIVMYDPTFSEGEHLLLCKMLTTEGEDHVASQVAIWENYIRGKQKNAAASYDIHREIP